MKRRRVPCSYRRSSSVPAGPRELVAEAQLLELLGVLRDDGSVVCRECGAELRRLDRGELERDGVELLFACVCGWALGRPEFSPGYFNGRGEVSS